MRYIKAFDLWNPAISGLIEQGKIQVQSGQIAYRQNRSDVSIIDEIKKGYVRAFHGSTVKEARSKYLEYKAAEKRAARRLEIRRQIKALEAEHDQLIKEM